MVAITDMKKVNVIIAPCDLRTCRPTLPAQSPAWTPDLYTKIRRALTAYPTRPASHDSLAAH